MPGLEGNQLLWWSTEYTDKEFILFPGAQGPKPSPLVLGWG